MQTKHILSIVVPFFNEARSVAPLHARICEALRPLGSFELIFVDDGSVDTTFQEIQKQRPVTALRLARNFGQTAALAAGIARATGDTIVTLDGDLENNPLDIPKLVSKLEEGFDLVIGSRYLEGISVVHWDLKRLLLSLWASFYARIITGLSLTDPMSGFKCYRKKVLENIPLEKVKSNGYSFQMEMHFRAVKAGFKLTEIPIVFVDRFNGKSKMGWRIILEAALMAPRLRLGLM